MTEPGPSAEDAPPPLLKRRAPQAIAVMAALAGAAAALMFGFDDGPADRVSAPTAPIAEPPPGAPPGGTLTLQLLAPEQFGPEIAAMALDEESRTQLALDVANDRVDLAQITLWDSHAQDGDLVRVVSAGYRLDAPLAKTPLTLAVPVAPGGVVTIEALADGGGGITLAAMQEGAPVTLAVLGVGQTLTLPYRLRAP